MTSDYFVGPTVNRQRLLYTVATRRQLERWEPLVAAAVLASFEGRQLDGADVWSADVEHHLVLVAARNLLRALELDPPSGVAITPTLRDELRKGRNLREHWNEPNRSPQWWLGWSNKSGARLLPNVSVSTLHRLLDDVEAEVLADDATLAEYVPPRAPSPWLHKDGEWWPKADAA